MKFISIILLVISSYGLFSCAATTRYPEKPKPSASASLTGQWFLTSLNGSGYQGSRISLQFNEKSRISGHSGCNRYFASSSRPTNGSLNFGFIGSTKKLCASQQANQLESVYLQALKQVQYYQLKGNQLVLGGNSTNLVFSR